MPTVEEDDSNGRYTRASQSTTGSVTYRTEEEAVDGSFESLGYSDGDDIPWGIIRPFRSAGLVYSDPEEVPTDQDDTLKRDARRVEQISHREKVLSHLQSRDDTPQRVFGGLRDTARNMSSENHQLLREAVESEFSESCTVRMVRRTDSSDEVSRIKINVGMVNHRLDLYSHDQRSDTKFIDEWSISCTRRDYGDWEHNWDDVADIYETKLGVIRAIGRVHDELSFNILWHSGVDSIII